ncbi:Glycyl-tRNA_synthetase [Hexamita inflata]|uniref:glycine--tRNA ligase n=1 Tax=Hexamita inflata TaxID=28002 RepID=A0AA86NL70_9EUKA|nr:Glycyl-tRNA synthetase [Hexamita inflata]CAI9940465.1 Glycyl-tRNA synthetase [Hexamita inflata]
MDKKEKVALENALTRRFFLAPAFEIYQGVAGLYDLGPCGAQIRQNLISQWRSHFVVNEDLQEVCCTCLVPEQVLIASGHVAKFADLMVKDTATGECYRADKIVEEQLQKRIDATTDAALKHELQTVFNQVDGLSQAETDKVITDYKITSEAGNPLSPCFPFNLMFQTTIGPSNPQKAYLRPETAQGIFMNFKRGFEQARGQLPFGIAQIGTAFRNEIAPRNGLLRVREFEQAEIEYFIKDRYESVKNFHEVKDMKVNLFSYQQQLNGEDYYHDITIGEAIEKKIINHEYLGYFIGRCQQFLVSVGLDVTKLRFRQHLPKQLAHYAKDCWDCDCMLYCGWTEIVGIADRSAYDLQVHSKASGTDMSAFVKYDTPVQKELFSAKAVMKILAKEFKQNAQALKQAIETASQEEYERISNELPTGKFTILGLQLSAESIQLVKAMQSVHGESITPIVIEPSFGIGRIIYSILEHSFYMRENDEMRTVFKFNPTIAPCKCAVISLMQKDELETVTTQLIRQLRKIGISCKSDDSGVQIGKKYARFDEIGIPYIVTVDFDSLTDKKVTLRERDSMAQIRIDIATINQTINDLVQGYVKFEELK